MRVFTHSAPKNFHQALIFIFFSEPYLIFKKREFCY